MLYGYFTNTDMLDVIAKSVLFNYTLLVFPRVRHK